MLTDGISHLIDEINISSDFKNKINMIVIKPLMEYIYKIITPFIIQIFLLFFIIIVQLFYVILVLNKSKGA